MNRRADSVRISTAADQAAGGGEIPASALHFRTGRSDEAADIVVKHHYSKSCPQAIDFVGTLHLDGGLFGGDGRCVAAAIFRCPPTRWAEPVLELSRMVRAEKRVPLSFLLARCYTALRRRGFDLLVSFADRTQGHDGHVYRASGWNYAGCRDRAMDGLVIDGAFVPGRTAYDHYGTRSPEKLRERFPHKVIEAHFDEGKHLYWRALGRRGLEKARRLGLPEISKFPVKDAA